MKQYNNEIIDLLIPSMNKSLTRGCLCKFGTQYLELFDIDTIGCRFFENGKIKRKKMVGKNVKDIIGHYDISAVITYFGYKNILIIRQYFYVTIDGLGHSFPNKPLHLYTEQEEKDLLELMLKYKKYLQKNPPVSF